MISDEWNAAAILVAYGQVGDDVGTIISGHSRVPYGQLIPRDLQVKLVGVEKPVNIGRRVGNLKSAGTLAWASDQERVVLKSCRITVTEDGKITDRAREQGRDRYAAALQVAYGLPGA
ncbi:hypothetical protein, partial [Streptomyces sp. IB201691-2A2]|uniref:hypothetical protein n=1 Tax=Streptomyces sp. IB201691-2A2 TaxID=2561920 RepID=UPI00117F3D6D